VFENNKISRISIKLRFQTGLINALTFDHYWKLLLPTTGNRLSVLRCGKDWSGSLLIPISIGRRLIFLLVGGGWRSPP